MGNDNRISTHTSFQFNRRSNKHFVQCEVKARNSVHLFCFGTSNKYTHFTHKPNHLIPSFTRVSSIK